MHWLIGRYECLVWNKFFFWICLGWRRRNTATKEELGMEGMDMREEQGLVNMSRMEELGMVDMDRIKGLGLVGSGNVLEVGGQFAIH